MIVVVEALDGGLRDCPVHPLDLTVGRGVLHFGQPMLDTVIVADPVEDILKGVSIGGSVGELDAFIG
jgi:hypothetical protein